jgi:hypothetical protein
MEEQKNIVVYQSEDGQIEFNVNVFDETVWLTQKQMSELFGRDRITITRHISGIFKEGELQKKAVCSKFEHTAHDGKKYQTQYYNLDVIISVGYRVKSAKGIQFRQWATRVLKQYMLQGYAINESRLTKIESKLEESLLELNQINHSGHDVKQQIGRLEGDVDTIKQLLLTLVGRPININIMNHSTGSKLENKLINVLDAIIDGIGESPIKDELHAAKESVSEAHSNPLARNRVVSFFEKLGDKNSSMHKRIEGAGVARHLFDELISLGKKIHDLFL